MNHDLLGLSLNEKYVFDALREGFTTPLEIAKKTRVPRPTVYITLESLKSRGLVERRKEGGKFYWKPCSIKFIEEKLYEAKKYLFDFAEGKEEIRSQGDSFVIIHRGKDAITQMLGHMFKAHKNENMYGIQGKKSTDAWASILPVSTFDDINNHIKKNHILVYAILEEEWAFSSAKKFGNEWVKNFEGRTTSVHELPAKYMNYSTEIWLFKNSAYMLAPREEIVVEIKNSDLVLMIKTIFSFIEDHTKKVDINHLLRGTF